MSELRIVSAPDDALEAVWVDPLSVMPNENNPRVHPKDQSQVLKDFIAKMGWLEPLLYNRRTGKLLEGHDRLNTAIKERWPAVPVWIGSWWPKEEAEVILMKSEVGRMATWDSEKGQPFIDLLSGVDGILADMVAELADREGMVVTTDPESDAILQDLVSTAESDGKLEFPGFTPTINLDAEGEDEEHGAEIEPSKVRLLSLFLDDERLEAFRVWDIALQDSLDVKDTTSVVMVIMKEAYDKLFATGS